METDKQTKKTAGYKLSIVIPAYNEERTVLDVLQKVCTVELPPNISREILIVNDCSTDRTGITVLNYLKENRHLNIRYIAHNENQGKGAAIHSGINHATGD